jgi:hypothetical protein
MGSEAGSLARTLRRPAASAGRRAWPILAVQLAVVLLGAPACPRTPETSDFRPGMARSRIVQQFGPPATRQTFHKSSEAIWGPIEDFWSRVPVGSTVEVWSYRVRGGSVELYFVDGSEQVQGTAFAPEGAVF